VEEVGTAKSKTEFLFGKARGGRPRTRRLLSAAPYHASGSSGCVRCFLSPFTPPSLRKREALRSPVFAFPLSEQTRETRVLDLGSREHTIGGPYERKDFLFFRSDFNCGAEFHKSALKRTAVRVAR
jgi:hypothetical protein